MSGQARDRRETDRRAQERRGAPEETMRAIVVEQWGDPTVMELKRVARAQPQEGEALVRVEYAGVNYVDIYHRTGLYPKEPPFTPGLEAAGVVEALGAGVTDPAVGTRVAFAMAPGAYAEYVSVPAWKLVALPDGVDSRDAAALMVQGMTAHYLSHDTYAIQQGDVVLVHAVAGGVGLLLTQMASRLGATVIGTCSTEEKAERARAAGARHVVLYTQEDFLPRTLELTDGAGVHAVYDSVGRDTFEDSLRALRPRGCLVLYGQSSGPVAALDPQRLAAQGSVFLTRPSLADYAADAQQVRAHAEPLFDWLRAGELEVRIEDVLPLQEAARAHQLLEGRRTSGKLLLASEAAAS